MFKPFDGGLVYEYVVRVIDENGRVVGVEEAGYTIYEIVWVSWDPIEYIYKPAGKDADSAFKAIKKI